MRYTTIQMRQKFSMDVFELVQREPKSTIPVYGAFVFQLQVHVLKVRLDAEVVLEHLGAHDALSRVVLVDWHLEHLKLTQQIRPFLVSAYVFHLTMIHVHVYSRIVIVYVHGYLHGSTAGLARHHFNQM